MTMATLIKENLSLELAYRIRGLLHYRHGGKHGSIQGDVGLEKELILRQQKEAGYHTR